LGIQNASIEHFIREAKNIKSGDQLEYIGNVFLELESWLDKAATSEKVHSLRMMQIWPIRSKGSSSSYDYLGVGEQRAVNWYIADRAHLATAFESKVSLLAFSVDDVARMEKLLQALAKTPSRLLTAVTKSFASTSAHLEPKEDFARMLRGKASFILRYVASSIVVSDPVFQLIL
jgi:hypothetical protein